MNVIIVEDEKPAAKRLERLISELRPHATITCKVDSVKAAVGWFARQEPVDLVFMDIQLGDGLSFEIFDYIAIEAPIIFTTAYDEYAIKAFKVNSVDYLLKPIDSEELSNALGKYDKLTQQHAATDQVNLDQIRKAMGMLNRHYKNRFLVKVGEHIKTINVDDFAYCYSREKVTYCITKDRKHYILDHSLQQLMDMLNPDEFFQVNRQYLITVASITDMISYSNSRLRLVLTPDADEEVIVSRDRVQEFKSWLDR